MKNIISELTPTIFAFLSAGLAIAVITNPSISDAKADSAFNISLALASGSAGMAVSGARQDDS